MLRDGGTCDEKPTEAGPRFARTDRSTASQAGDVCAVADAMAMTRVKSTIVPWPQLVEWSILRKKVAVRNGLVRRANRRSSPADCRPSCAFLRQSTWRIVFPYRTK